MQTRWRCPSIENFRCHTESSVWFIIFFYHIEADSAKSFKVFAESTGGGGRPSLQKCIKTFSMSIKMVFFFFFCIFVRIFYFAYCIETLECGRQHRPIGFSVYCGVHYVIRWQTMATNGKKRTWNFCCIFFSLLSNRIKTNFIVSR